MLETHHSGREPSNYVFYFGILYTLFSVVEHGFTWKDGIEIGSLLFSTPRRELNIQVGGPGDC